MSLQAEMTRFENLPGRAKLQEYLRQLCAALHQVYKMRNPTGANNVDATGDRGFCKPEGSGRGCFAAGGTGGWHLGKKGSKIADVAAADTCKSPYMAMHTQGQHVVLLVAPGERQNLESSIENVSPVDGGSSDACINHGS